MEESLLLLEIGEGIKRVMKQKNITRGELSRKTGITPQQISKYCHGLIYPTARNLTKILNGLNASLHDITRPT